MELKKCRWHEKKKREHAIRVGISYANSWFKDYMEIPGFRGPDFKWADFPRFVQRMTKVSAYMYFPGLCKDEIYDLAAQTAFDHVAALIKEYNLV